MADADLQRQFRQRLNRYQTIEQWLGDRLRRRAKANDWLRNRLIRAILQDDAEAAAFNERLRAANPPSNRVDYFRGVFDILPTGNVPGLEFDLALDQLDSLVRTCAYLQSLDRKAIRRQPVAHAAPDFIVTDDAGDHLVQTVNMRRYAQELLALYDAVAALRCKEREFASCGLTVHGTEPYLLARYELKLAWRETSARILHHLDDATVAAAIRRAMSEGASLLADGALGIRAGGDGLKLALLPPDARVQATEHPFSKALRLEISTNVGWMHNHALANDMRSQYLIFVDATRIDAGLPSLDDLRPLLEQYMALMWDTNPEVTLHIVTDHGALDFPAPGAPISAL